MQAPRSIEGLSHRQARSRNVVSEADNPSKSAESNHCPVVSRRVPEGPPFSQYVLYGSRYNRAVPQISRFFGIVIAMYYNDHAPPHFHARYGEHEATFSIDTLAVLEGSLPQRATALVLEWASQHRDELARDWDLARQAQPLQAIAPLE
jgi:hypothetical protein